MSEYSESSESSEFTEQMGLSQKIIPPEWPTAGILGPDLVSKMFVGLWGVMDAQANRLQGHLSENLIKNLSHKLPPPSVYFVTVMKMKILLDNVSAFRIPPSIKQITKHETQILQNQSVPEQHGHSAQQRRGFVIAPVVAVFVGIGVQHLRRFVEVCLTRHSYNVSNVDINEI